MKISRKCFALDYSNTFFFDNKLLNIQTIDNMVNYFKTSLGCAIVLLMLSLTVSANGYWKYYEVTGDGVNLRKAPNGQVFGKVAKGTFFMATEPEDGWIYISTPLQSGFVSVKFVKEVSVGKFSRSMAGSVVGMPVDQAWSYSLGDLREHDGWVTLSFANWSEPMESGMRLRDEGFSYAGKPTANGVDFTYRLYGYDPESPLQPQLESGEYLSHQYIMVVETTSDGSTSLRTFDQSFSVEPTSEKDPVVSERCLFGLKGAVKKLVHARSYVPSFMSVMDDAEVFENYVDMALFEADGMLASYCKVNADSEKVLDNYKYTRQGDRVYVEGYRYENPVKGDYKIGTSNFTLNYEDGEFKVDYGENGSDEAGISGEYSIGWNGLPEEIYFDGDGRSAPFIRESNAGTFTQTVYDSSTGMPKSASLRFDYGGEGYAFDVEFRDVQKDAKGNWTKRVAYDLEGSPMFIELREIEYF